MKRYYKIIMLLLSLLVFGCSHGYITTEPIHEPIYPAAGESVTYTLDMSSAQGISNVKLFETVSSVSATGTVTAGTETLVNEWNPSGSPNTLTVNFTQPGYSANKLITYRFHVTNGSGGTRNHEVTYAIRPYPVANQPAPVFVQGDVDDVFDAVFIPDSDISNMATFRSNCRNMILNTVFREPTMKFFCRSFNFYINPLTGTATDYDRISTDGYHQLPANMANLNFAEAVVLMHQNNLRDYAFNGVFSTEMDKPQTFIHEGGHAMFNLADEYSGGAHWQETTLPNNWSSLAGAQADAPGRHKTAADAVQMGTTGWHKICDATCPMISGGALLFDYEDPCADRVIYSIIDNAID